MKESWSIRKSPETWNYMSMENSDHIEMMNKAAVEQMNQATCLLNAIQSGTRNKDLLSLFIHCDSSKLC